MNLEEFPTGIQEDIEDQSLEILERINDNLIVIGGWGVRAHLGTSHNRSTLDVDVVADEASLKEIRETLGEMGFAEREADWGIGYFAKYNPRVDVPKKFQEDIQIVELRIEPSLPRITEKQTPHYFEFSLDEYEIKVIHYHGQDKELKIKVAPIEHITAQKLGLPVDYKNCHDAAMMLEKCDIGMVIQSIQGNDNWSEMFLRRLPKLVGRISQPGSRPNILALNSGLDIKKHIGRLKQIEQTLK